MRRAQRSDDGNVEILAVAVWIDCRLANQRHANAKGSDVRSEPSAFGVRGIKEVEPE